MDGISQVAVTGLEDMSGFVDFFTNSRWAESQGMDGVCDFVLGNPHDGVLPGVTQALVAAAEPRSPDWHAYKLSEPNSQKIVADSLQRDTGIAFEPDDIAMTNGAFAGLAVTLLAIANPGDEVIYVSPPWFFYTALIHGAGATAVKVHVDEDTFEIDVDAIEAAITPRTSAVLINSPHNPTGKIATPDILADLANRLNTASASRKRPIYLISDEAYRRILFDGRSCPTAASYYPNTFLVYTYGKTLLTPGERLGYVALPPNMPNRETMRNALIACQIMTGYAFPNALLQHSLADLDRLSIDISQLRRRRDLIVSTLRKAGLEVKMPEGTFYVLCKAPVGDDMKFAQRLADQNVFVLPGEYFEMPGYVRFSLTATDAMVERAIPVLASCGD